MKPHRYLLAGQKLSQAQKSKHYYMTSSALLLDEIAGWTPRFLQGNPERARETLLQRCPRRAGNAAELGKTQGEFLGNGLGRDHGETGPAHSLPSVENSARQWRPARLTEIVVLLELNSVT
jgi:hypothetical protein